MRISFTVLGCYLFGSTLTAHIKIRDPGLPSTLREKLLYRRPPAHESKAESSVQQLQTVYTQVETLPAVGQNFPGTTFAKSEHKKQVVSGDIPVGLGATSKVKVSSGGTMSGRGRMRAVATGKNTQVKLTVLPGGRGSFYAEQSGGEKRTVNTIDHTQSPFRWNPPADQSGHPTKIHGQIDGEGAVKVKAWN